MLQLVLRGVRAAPTAAAAAAARRVGGGRRGAAGFSVSKSKKLPAVEHWNGLKEKAIERFAYTPGTLLYLGVAGAFFVFFTRNVMLENEAAKDPQRKKVSKHQLCP